MNIKNAFALVKSTNPEKRREKQESLLNPRVAIGRALTHLLADTRPSIRTLYTNRQWTQQVVVKLVGEIFHYDLISDLQLAQSSTRQPSFCYASATLLLQTYAHLIAGQAWATNQLDRTRTTASKQAWAHLKEAFCQLEAVMDFLAGCLGGGLHYWYSTVQ